MEDRTTLTTTDLTRRSPSVVHHRWDDLAAGYRVAGRRSEAVGRSAAFHPDGSPLWVVTAELARGEALQWGSDHGDELVFVIGGALDGDALVASDGVVVIVPAGVEGSLGATADTRLVHFGSTARAIERHGQAPDRFSTIPAHGWRSMVLDLEGVQRDVQFYCDGTCVTTPLSLLRVRCDTSFGASSHVHSRDEIIYLVRGDMQVGAIELRPGSAVCVPAQYRYGFRSRDGADFLNFRDGIATAVFRPGDPVHVETADALGMAPAAS